MRPVIMRFGWMPMTSLSQVEKDKLQAILERLRAGDQAAFVVRCACDPSPDGTGGDTVVDHIRLFPIREDVRWVYRVHEQILPTLRRAGVPVKWTDLTVRHTGYVDRALRARKLDRDTKILNRELEDRPNDPFVLFNLGAIAVERRAWHEALGFLRRSLAGSAPTDSIVRKLFALIARDAPDDGGFARGAADLRRGARARPAGCRAVVPQGDGASASGRIIRGRAMLAADLDAQASRPVLQRRPGDLRPPDPAQPGGPGRRAR